MDKKVTFSVSTNGDESEIQQTFSLGELNLEPDLSKEAAAERIQELFKRWLRGAISYSITIDGDYPIGDPLDDE